MNADDNAERVHAWTVAHESTQIHVSKLVAASAPSAGTEPRSWPKAKPPIKVAQKPVFWHLFKSRSRCVGAHMTDPSKVEDANWREKEGGLTAGLA
jgi:hypothetical protein